MHAIATVSAIGWAAILILLPRIVLSAIDGTYRKIAIRLTKQGYSPTQVQNMIGLTRRQLRLILGSHL